MLGEKQLALMRMRNIERSDVNQTKYIKKSIIFPEYAIIVIIFFHVVKLKGVLFRHYYYFYILFCYIMGCMCV